MPGPAKKDLEPDLGDEEMDQDEGERKIFWWMADLLAPKFNSLLISVEMEQVLWFVGFRFQVKMVSVCFADVWEPCVGWNTQI